MISTNRERHPWPVPPLGACYVASSLEQKGHEVQLLDMLYLDNPSSEVFRKIKQFAPDMVGVSIRNIDNLDQQSSFFYLEGIKSDVIDPVHPSQVPRRC
jgi:response regulator RpfG family c-di-GMP phosphodiesterase